MKHEQLSTMLRLVFFILFCICIPINAFAQAVDPAQNAERMDRVEHDIMLLQRQVARGETVSAPAGGDIVGANPAQLEIRLSAMEDQMRQLQGKIEENENRNAKLLEALEKFQKDTEFRLNELSTTPNASSTAAREGKPPVPLNQQMQSLQAKPNAPTAAHVPDSIDKADAGESNFTSPREHYNYAFRLLNQTQYEESAAAFESFTKKYPKDPLVGNAYYWEGETFYIRRDYVNAADNFRKGFEALPEGPKAADNLLKLAMSLDALNRDKEACLVLQQISSKYKRTSSSVVDKAEQEEKRIGCRPS